ncbi:MAG: PAS domain S-box protein [Desulfobacterales bacterium]|nr:PAS domain S-box protein [Desulfobacterales bacterium]
MQNIMINLNKWIETHFFNKIPMVVAVINREFNIVKANDAFEKMFGTWRNKKCFSVYKDRESMCPSCKGAEAFNDGIPRVTEEIGYNKNGKIIYYIQHTTPIFDEKGNIPFLVEMTIDTTELKQIRKEHHLLFEQVPCNILLIDKNLRVVKANKKVTQSFGRTEGNYCYEAFKGKSEKCEECPAQESFNDGKMHTGFSTVKDKNGEIIHFHVTTLPLKLTGNSFDWVMEMAVDITQLKQLEKEKIEAERLATVGETVAGLAHGIKNLLTGLEGGMYMLNTGITKGKIDRVQKGLEMLDRNVTRISMFVKEFLSFSKGREINVQNDNPEKIAKEVVDLYSQRAEELGIELKYEFLGEISPAPMDYEGIHECLTNLIGNAIDACRLSDKQGKYHVNLKVYEKDSIIYYEVIDDGCGMDYEVKKKVFTTFFTTKGLGGTGLGLLTTKKIIQEHGGKIEMESEEGKGTIFRIILPRDHLPEVKQKNG